MADSASVFRGIANDAAKGLVLKPLIHNYLYDAEWPEDFSVRFKRGAVSREPDGWFHPSEHPLWPARMLWFLVTQPKAMIPEKMAYMNTLAVTMGTAVHSFIEVCLKHIGVLLGPEELVALGFTVNPENGEPSFSDPETLSRGHGDGVLKNIVLPQAPEHEFHLFEFKTSNGRKLAKVDDLDLAAFMATWPEYYAQAQEYLRMTGMAYSIILFMEMGFPWNLKEFHIPANTAFQRDTRDKYLEVREFVKTGHMPPPCCGPGSKEAKSCPARAVCPVGMA